MMFALHMALLLVGGALTWRGSELLEDGAGDLCRHYRVPDLVRGTLVVAVGSSFPELTTVIVSTLVHGEFSLGMASIVGSAIFNILVIPGMSGVLGGPLRYDVRVVYRDAQFYLTSVAVLLVAFSLALVYNPSPATTQGAALVGTMTPPIALLPLALYGLYLFLQYQETRGAGAAELPEGADEDGMSGGEVARAWLKVALSLLLVLAGVEALLRVALFLGDALGTPSFLWGATVVAAATSVPDALISVRSAKRGEGDVSIGNVLGSNIFDLLVAIPVGVLLAGAAPVEFGVAAPLMAALAFATVILFAQMRTDLMLTRRECAILLVLYAVFVVWLTLETLGMTSLLLHSGAQS